MLLVFLLVESDRGTQADAVPLAWPFHFWSFSFFLGGYFEGEEFPVLRLNPGVQCISFVYLVRFSSLTVYRRNASDCVHLCR